MICILFSPTSEFIPTILTRCTEIESQTLLKAFKINVCPGNKCEKIGRRKEGGREGRREGSRENSLLPFSHSFSFADRPFPAAFSRSPGSRSLAGLESSLGRSGTRQKAAFILHKAAAAATTRKEEEEEAYHPDRNAGRDRNSSIYLSTFFNSDRRPS